MTVKGFNKPPHTALLKLSGAVFAPPHGRGLQARPLQRIAEDLVQAQQAGTRLGVVVGGGNFWRGRDVDFIDRISADHIGMLGTIANGLALQAGLRQLGVDSLVQSAVAVALADPIHPQRAKAALAQGKIVIFVGGTGNPLVSTDTAAAVRAVEIGAEVLLKGSNVDGVYDADPNQNPEAKRYATLHLDEALSQQLNVMDLGAFEICRQHRVPILVFDVCASGNVARALRHPKIGTLIT